ncbi:MAG: hypothetical protein JST16_15730 [Bdellovibrionales bacterium]|nr:hypothetical protein [Bdellovibrionales bacterium]
MKLLMLGTLLSCAAWASSSIEGTWTTPCMPVGSAFGYETLSFFRGTWNFSLYTYADATCSDTYLDQHKSSGTYSTGSEHGEGTAIDMRARHSETNYSIYTIEQDNRDEVLYLGSFATSPDSRPKTVRRNAAYYRQ